MFAKPYGRRIASALLLCGLSLIAVTGCQKGPISGPGPKTPAATKAVGAVDVEVLQGLPEFKEARKKVDDFAKKTEEEARKKLGNKKPGEFTEQDRVYITGIRQKIQKFENETIGPLTERLKACILKVSRDKKLVVVLDKRIVVYGVPDYTEDVKSSFQSKEELKMGDEVDTSKAPIGYFDQDVVQSLKVFQQVQVELLKKANEMKREFEDKGRGMSPAEQQVMYKDMMLKLEAYKEQMMTSLISQVDESVKEVAQKEGLALVLDKTHVLEGGRNMTTEVVDTFLKKTAAPAKSPKASPTPGGTP